MVGEPVNPLLEAENKRLRAENHQLREEVSRLKHQNGFWQGQASVLRKICSIRGSVIIVLDKWGKEIEQPE